MGRFGIMKKTLSVLVLVFFVAALTAASVSAASYEKKSGGYGAKFEGKERSFCGKEMYKGKEMCKDRFRNRFEGKERCSSFGKSRCFNRFC